MIFVCACIDRSDALLRIVPSTIFGEIEKLSRAEREFNAHM